jgi:hypothetical protein
MVLQTVLFVFGFVLLALATLNVASPKVSLGWAGLACWLAGILFPMLLR